MQPALAEAMDGMLEQYSDGVQTPERQVMVEFVRDLRQRLKGDAVVGVNAIVDAVLAKPSVLDALVRDLNKADVEAPGGFWELAYAGYGMRKAPPHAIELYVGDRPVPSCRSGRP